MNKRTEAQIISDITSNNSELKHYNSIIAKLRKQLMEAETELVGYQIKKDKLEEELQRHQFTTVVPDLDKLEDEKDLAIFIKKLPKIMKKLSKED